MAQMDAAIGPQPQLADLRPAALRHCAAARSGRGSLTIPQTKENANDEGTFVGASASPPTATTRMTANMPGSFIFPSPPALGLEVIEDHSQATMAAATTKTGSRSYW